MAETAKTEAIRGLIRASEVLDRIGCLTATDGNFSVRLGDNVVITCSGIEKRQLTDASFNEVSLAVEMPVGVSSEWNMHRMMYRKYSDIHCILHTHAPYLTTFAVTHAIPNTALLAECESVLGKIRFVPYQVPGSRELGHVLTESNAPAAVYLLANHGVVTVGRDITEALHRMERAEFLARIHIQSEIVGGGVPLSSEQVTRLQSPLK